LLGRNNDGGFPPQRRLKFAADFGGATLTMRSLLGPALALSLCAGAPVAAETQLAGPAPPPYPPGRMFLSPSGEPFRPSAQAPDPFAAWFAKADANHDGHIDRAEFRADAQAFFKLVDANGDGVIDGFEVNAYEHKIAPELAAEVENFGAEGGEHGGRSGGRGEHGHRSGGGRDDAAPAGAPAPRGGRGHLALLNEPEPVSGADADFDSKVTAAEWLTATDRRFDQLDDKTLGYLDLPGLETHLPKLSKPGKR
jgi:hypothetical protein